MPVTTDTKVRLEMLLDDRDRLRAEVARLTEENARLWRAAAAETGGAVLVWTALSAFLGGGLAGVLLGGLF